MFPFIYFIDCNGDMWIPCCCGNGATGASGTAESIAEEAVALPMPMEDERNERVKSRTIKKTIIDGKLVKTEILEQIECEDDLAIDVRIDVDDEDLI